MKSKQLRFADLVARVGDCKLCPRMSQRRPVLSPSNGNLNALVVFIAEAPGRLGADKSGIPLFGDQAGHNFDLLISSAGIKREAIFITNAVLCNPRNANGNNSPPIISEISNCSIHLKETIDIIQPEYIVPLGAKALAALNKIRPVSINIREVVGRLLSWWDYRVFPLYHPGSRAIIHRPLAIQVKDYKALAKLLGSNKKVSIERT